MTRRWRAAAQIACIVLNAGLAGFNTFLFFRGYYLNGVVALVNAGVAGSAVYIYRKDKARGRNRQAQEDSQDPGSCASRITSILTAAAWPPSPYTSYAKYSARAGELVASDEELQVVESDLPILAHRAARLMFAGSDKHWHSVNSAFGSFGVDADACCHQQRLRFTNYGESHEAPAVTCDCGFYALPPDLRSTFEGANYVTLLVELSGTVIEHDEGYRGQHQRVVECELPACPFCGCAAEQVVVAADHVMYAAVCGRHVPVLAEGQVVVSFDDVAALLPVPLTRAGRRVDA